MIRESDQARSGYTGAGSRSLTYSYTYDTVGNITQVVKSDRWDATADVTLGYQYDAHGNRLRQEDGTYTLSGSSYRRTAQSYTTFEYAAGSMLTRSSKYATMSTTTPAVTQYSYDGEGNLLVALGPSSTERYTYDTRGELVKAQAGGKNVYNTYDGVGRRIARKVTDATQPTEKTTEVSHYQYDGMFVVATRDGADGLKMAYGRLPSGRLLTWIAPGQGATAADNGGAFLVDHLGSVVKLTKGTGSAAVNQYDYDAFGNLKSSQEQLANDFKFTGVVLYGNGLYHLNARFYNPSVGRFITAGYVQGESVAALDAEPVHVHAQQSSQFRGPNWTQGRDCDSYAKWHGPRRASVAVA